MRTATHARCAIALGALSALLAGCGSPKPSPAPASSVSSGPAATVTPTDTPTATSKPTQPFLVTLDEGQGSTSSGQDTLTILDLAGGKHASVSFTPPQRLPAPSAITSVQPPATAAAGKALYIDSTGTVHALSPDGLSDPLARFPLHAGEEISFAVSPDASRILAVINKPVGPSWVDWQTWVYGATPNSGAQLLAGPVTSSSILRLFGWTVDGPVAITDAEADFQGCEQGQCAPFGRGAFIDPTTGVTGAAVGGSACEVWDIVGSAVLCSSGPRAFEAATPANLFVRSLDGSGGRPVTIAPRCAGCYWDARLSPEGDVALEVDTASGASTFVVSQGGTTRAVGLPPATAPGAEVFAPYLWVDAHTVVGVTDCASVGCTTAGGSVASIDTTAAALRPVTLNARGDPVATFTA